jgi:hypothetical protein
VKILIISFVHGNTEALSSVTESYDELWVLGDLVNYGPDPAGAIRSLRQRATLIVRGNHDHAVGYDVDPRCCLGQPKDGGPEASYAVWQDGEFTLRKVKYPVDRTVARLTELSLPAEITSALRHLLETGHPQTS